MNDPRMTEINRLLTCLGKQTKIYPYQHAVIDELNKNSVWKLNMAGKWGRSPTDFKGLHEPLPCVIDPLYLSPTPKRWCHPFETVFHVSPSLIKANKAAFWRRNRTAIYWTILILFICFIQVYLRGFLQ